MMMKAKNHNVCLGRTGPRVASLCFLVARSCPYTGHPESWTLLILSLFPLDKICICLPFYPALNQIRLITKNKHAGNAMFGQWWST